MAKVIKIRKGLNIRLLGEAERRVVELGAPKVCAVAPADFVGLNLRLVAAEGERVEAGQAIFADKKNPDILVVAPVSGVIAKVQRGERRVIEKVVIEGDKELTFKQFAVPEHITRESVVATLLQAGLWPAIVQRPYGVVANPEDKPQAVFVSGFDSAPLAPDMAYVLKDSNLDLKKGFEVLAKLTSGKVHLGIASDGDFEHVHGVEKTVFKGPHPAGNVGVQIANIKPISKGDLIWTVDIQHVAMIGRLFTTGKTDMTKTFAVTGSELAAPCYVRAMSGTTATELAVAAGGIVEHKAKKCCCGCSDAPSRARYISGNALSGTNVGAEGGIGFYSNQLTVLPEGDKFEMLGWAMPRLNKFSVSRTYFSWLQPGRKYVLDTNLNGGHRPFIVTGLFERYVPMDIYPMQLLKAIAAQDIDKMEALGIYEVVPEDFALCEFVDPSKNEIQQMVRDGISLIIKEM